MGRTGDKRPRPRRGDVAKSANSAGIVLVTAVYSSHNMSQ